MLYRYSFIVKLYSFCFIIGFCIGLVYPVPLLGFDLSGTFNSAFSSVEGKANSLYNQYAPSGFFSWIKVIFYVILAALVCFIIVSILRCIIPIISCCCSCCKKRKSPPL